MAVSPTPHLFTVKDYHRMAQADVFAPDERLELVDGKVLELAPIGSRHAACVKRLGRMFTLLLGERALVGIQDPVELSDVSEPQPDVALLRPRADFYAAAHPGASDVLLLVEVSESTAQYDRTTKLPLYLAAGVPEVWVVDLNAEVLHVAIPTGTRVVSRGESLAPGAFPDVVLEVAAIVG